MFKYVPVLRYRQEERRALSRIQFSDKTLPLIEIVKEKPNTKMRGNFASIHGEELGELNLPILIDFPMYMPLVTNTQTEVVNFLRPILSNQNNRIQKYNALAGNRNFIPVVSYNPNTALQQGYIIREGNSLRQNFNRLGFRLFLSNFQIAINDVARVIQDNDIIILDLGEDPHTNPGLQNFYQQIQRLVATTNCKSVIMRSAIPNNITNTSLVDNQIVPADNSLLTLYRTAYGFNAFGDFAGVKRDFLTDGGSVSPGYIFYVWNNNCYIGYKGRTRTLSEFENHIVPTLINSPYWANYNATHQQNCPGCSTIASISRRMEAGNSQAKWKGIAVMHYLHTMEEFL